jgi:hypothetical protein
MMLCILAQLEICCSPPGVLPVFAEIHIVSSFVRRIGSLDTKITVECWDYDTMSEPDAVGLFLLLV